MIRVIVLYVHTPSFEDSSTLLKCVPDERKSIERQVVDRITQEVKMNRTVSPQLKHFWALVALVQSRLR